MENNKLTYEEKSGIICYVLMTTKYRENERKTWEKLAEEKDESGAPRFKNAAENARYYAELEDKLAAIVAKLGG